MDKKTAEKKAWQRIMIIGMLLLLGILFVIGIGFIVTMTGDDNYKQEEMAVSIPIQVDVNDTVNFFESLRKVSEEYDSGLMLGNIFAITEDGKTVIEVTYGKELWYDAEGASSVTLFYDVENRSVFKIKCCLGSYKIGMQVSEAMNVAQWKLTMGEANEKFANWYKEQGVPSYGKLEVNFEEEETYFHVFSSQNDIDSLLDFTLKMN